MITTTPAWRNAAQISRKGVVLVRLKYGDETNYLTIAASPIPRLESEYYRPMLIESPVDMMGVDMYTHKVQTSELTLRISNGDYHPGVKFSDLINDTTLGAGDDIGIENREADVRLWTEGITTWATCIQLRSGVFREISHSQTELVLSIQDKREIIHKKIEHLIVETDAADTDEGLPDSGRGKTKPVIGGNHIHFRGDDAKALDTASTFNNLVPCVYLGINTSGKHEWQVSSHQLDEALVAGNQVEFWGFDRSLGADGRFVRLANSGGTDVTIVNGASGAVLAHIETPGYLDYQYGKGTVVASKAGGGIVTGFDEGGSDETNVADKDFSSLATAAFANLADVNDYAQFLIPFAAWDNQNFNGTVGNVDIHWYGKWTFTGGIGAGDVSVEHDDTGAFGGAEDVFSVPTDETVRTEDTSASANT
ncbi:hypothetical protein LCGC14_2572880, partial [marine sediment metagenome]